MNMHHLKMGVTFLLAVIVTACGSGGGGGSSLPAVSGAATTQDSTGTRGVSGAAATQSMAVSRGTSSESVHALASSAYTAIDVGGAASGNWIADVGFSGGLVAKTKEVIATGNISNPAPQAVYQTQRYAPYLVYTVANLAPNNSYNVRLHFVESYFRAAGKRIFSAKISGTQVFTNFDIFAAAGGANIAIVKSYLTTADTTGKITLAFTAIVNNASIAGIEVSNASVAPTPTPSPAPTTTPSSGVGPRVPVGPQASITCPPGSVQISPGTNVQSVVNAHSAGTSYCFAAGTYSRQQITPQSGDTYVGVKGAILDGASSVQNAFSGSASSVTIKNLVVQHYAPTTDNDGAIADRWTGGTNWTLANNEVLNSARAGISVGSGTNVVANYIHDNAQTGYMCGGTGVTFTDNVIATNNPTNINFGSDMAGGGKCLSSTNLVMKYNYIHDNRGPGVWTDTDNQGTVYAYNDIENNWSGGIFHEISWDASIFGNVMKNNESTSSCPSLSFWCSEIMIANSGGVHGKIIDVYGNTVVSNAQQFGNGITLLNESRGSGLYGTWMVQNVRVHNNTIDVSRGGAIGAVTYNGDVALFSSQGNTFQNDAYTGAVGNAFYWNGKSGNFSFFQSNGQETGGTSH